MITTESEWEGGYCQSLITVDVPNQFKDWTYHDEEWILTGIKDMFEEIIPECVVKVDEVREEDELRDMGDEDHFLSYEFNLWAPSVFYTKPKH